MLRNARGITHKWIRGLGSKLDTAEDDTTRNNLRRQMCALAATCSSTYDVSLEHVPWALACDDDIAIALHCAAVVRDNTPFILHVDDSCHLKPLLKRHYRLLHFLEPFFQERVQSNSSGFDRGLATIWPGSRRLTHLNWHTLPSPNSRWITCTVEGDQGVHYNLLTGQTLISGKQLGRLPRGIISHSTYASILGTVCPCYSDSCSFRHIHVLPQRILEVVPADVPWMDFMTKSDVSGYQVGYYYRRRVAANASEVIVFVA